MTPALSAVLAIALSSPAFAGEGQGNDCKIDICHFPPGNPENVQVISVGPEALDAHLAHGDSMGFMGFCYVFVPVPTVADDAEAACRDDFGGHLASIHSQAEDDYISHLVDPLGMGRITAHVGAISLDPDCFDMGPSADYAWTDGTPWDFENWREETSEPNCGHATGGGAVQFWPSSNVGPHPFFSGWNDVRRDRAELHGYVCKFGGY
jgi:hypothetical protein